jgi:hypothetical protein
MKRGLGITDGFNHWEMIRCCAPRTIVIAGSGDKAVARIARR